MRMLQLVTVGMILKMEELKRTLMLKMQTTLIHFILKTGCIAQKKYLNVIERITICIMVS